MKKYLAGFILCILTGILFSSNLVAVQQVWTSSHTATADTTQILCNSRTYIVGSSTYTAGGKAILHSVCVNDAGAAGTITIYNSSSTATNTFAILRATTTANGPCAYFDVDFSSGLVYTTGAANDVTFTFECY